jgi:catechol 2,3-dioxygenase-like lactoylglutathione lyase family enzyme
MSLSLDHLVILVHELEQAIAHYTELGFTVQRGGVHADGATHNALIGFDDGSYLELIAFLKPAPQHRWYGAAQNGRQGFLDFALLPQSVGAAITAAVERGLNYQGPIDGGRLRPDGERLAWQIGTPPSSAELPFLCGDLTARALRVPEGEVRRHANGVLGIASITLAVPDLEASLARYSALLGPQALQQAAPVALPALGLRYGALSLGSTTLVLLSPAWSDGQGVPLTLRDQLAVKGPGLFGVALRGTGGGPAKRLPLSQTHGAHFEIHPL